MAWLQKTPIVAVLFAVAMASVPFLLASNPTADAGANPFGDARDEARAYLMRNPRLEVDAMGELILDAAWIEEARATAAASDTVAVELPARLMARSQAKLDELVALAYQARLESDPAWRLGVLDARTPAQNYVAHAFIHETMAGVILCCLVLLLAGAPLERVWGSPVFALFVLAAIPATAQAYRLLDASSGVPWSGGAGLAGALLGAYFIRSLAGDLVLPGWVLLPAWLGGEAFVVRGFWLDDLGSVPWTTVCAAIALGAATAGALRLLGFESRAVASRAASGPNPVVARAARLRSDGDPYQAFDLIQAAWRETPDDDELREAFFDIAVEVDQPEAAVDAVLPLLRTALRAGEVDRAVDYWFPLAKRECPARLEPTAAIRLGEALLDKGHPEQALFSLRGALEAGVSSAHATRIVGIARDLDPGLARQAAQIALSDPALEPGVRADLEPIVDTLEARPSDAQPEMHPPSRSQLDRRVSAEHQTVETTAFPIALDDDLEDPSTETPVDDHEAALAEQALDPGALSAEHLAEEAPPQGEAPAGGGSDVLSHWSEDQDDTMSDLSASLDDMGLEESLLDADDLESPDAGLGFAFEGTAPELEPLDDDTDLTPMMDATDELTSPMDAPTEPNGDADARTMLYEMPERSAESDEAATQFMAAEDGEAATQFMAADESSEAMAGGGPDAPPQATQLVSLRPIKAIEAVPVQATEEWIEIDAVGGRGKSKLPMTRLQAISIAAVDGLGPRPVLVMDLVLNWVATDEPMKSIRVRSDRFDPMRFAPDASDPLEALTRWVGAIERASNATCLPAQAILDGRFTRHASLADYEREILIGVSAD